MYSAPTTIHGSDFVFACGNRAKRTKITAHMYRIALRQDLDADVIQPVLVTIERVDAPSQTRALEAATVLCCRCCDCTPDCYYEIVIFDNKGLRIKSRRYDPRKPSHALSSWRNEETI